MSIFTIAFVVYYDTDLIFQTVAGTISFIFNNMDVLKETVFCQTLLCVKMFCMSTLTAFLMF